MYVNHIKSIVMAVLTILLGGFAVECGRDTDHKLDSIAQIIETNPDQIGRASCRERVYREV